MNADLSRPTLGVSQMAELLDCAEWTIYQHPDTLVAPIRVGRKLRWPTALVLEALGMERS